MAEGFYVPEADITAAGPDGVERLVAAKGVPVLMAEARAKGLIKDRQQAAPQETKINPDYLATVQGAEVTEGDLKADLANPQTIGDKPAAAAKPAKGTKSDKPDAE